MSYTPQPQHERQGLWPSSLTNSSTPRRNRQVSRTQGHQPFRSSPDRSTPTRADYEAMSLDALQSELVAQSATLEKYAARLPDHGAKIVEKLALLNDIINAKEEAQRQVDELAQQLNDMGIDDPYASNVVTASGSSASRDLSAKAKSKQTDMDTEQESAHKGKQTASSTSKTKRPVLVMSLEQSLQAEQELLDSGLDLPQKPHEWEMEHDDNEHTTTTASISSSSSSSSSNSDSDTLFEEE